MIEEPPLTPAVIRDRADALLARLGAAARRAGRDPDGFRLVAVTKGFPVAVVRAAREAGLGTFGENRVQEAIPKVEAVPDAEWHLVGHLQANKVRRALGLFATIHSVDSLELLQRIERIAHDDDRRPRLLLQVNVAGEASKAGFDPAELDPPSAALAGVLGRASAGRASAGRANVAGLMTMAPAGAGEAELRTIFGTLRGLRDRLQEALGLPLPELSMGMTADAEAAVAEGATLVRIGTGIFGPPPG
ncbi:MAG: YggS family pyridoxal phosphate-dependent enzyme [Candidatus Limnocylindria bacterium]